MSENLQESHADLIQRVTKLEATLAKFEHLLSGAAETPATPAETAPPPAA